jgi:hypothetical protein
LATTTQFNPNAALNEQLFAAGASKTVYALVTPEIEAVKAKVFGSYGEPARQEYMDQFRGAWTAKQDRYHEDFFDAWCHWSKPVVDLDRSNFPFYYPTAGASEPLRHLIFEFAAKGGKKIHVFEGEYEGYKAMAEAAGLRYEEHPRDGKDGWHTPFGGRLNRITSCMVSWTQELFFISQPSAIDGNVWAEFNEFISKMPPNSVVADLTYVGAVPQRSVLERFDMNQPAIRNVVFSLSKPFGAYYDRIGGVFCREENLGLFGNKWFKGLTGLSIGNALLRKYDVFYMPNTYRLLQLDRTKVTSVQLGIDLKAADVFMLATGEVVKPEDWDDVGKYLTRPEIVKYLQRAGKTRVCLTPGMAAAIGTV